MTQLSILTEISECPVCCSQMNDKIYICPNGHDLCNGCFSLLRGPHICCPQCKVSYVYDCNREPTRNRSLERLLSKSTLPCSFTSNGCTVNELAPEQKKQHTRSCKHQLIQCPYAICHINDQMAAEMIFRNASCNIGLTLDEMLLHAKKEHNIDTFCSMEDEFLFELDDKSAGEGHWRMFLREHDDDKCSCLNKPSLEFCQKLKCVLLIGYKNKDNEISLCARSVIPNHVGNEYHIEVQLPQQSIKFVEKMRGLHEALGLETKHDQCLTLNKATIEQMAHSRQQTTIMKVFI